MSDDNQGQSDMQWIFIEFGIHVDYGQDLEVSEKLLPQIKESVLEAIEEYQQDYPDFLENPFDLSSKNPCLKKILPSPDYKCFIVDSLKLHYVYDYDSQPVQLNDLEQSLTHWWSLWDNSYHESGNIGVIRNNDQWIPMDEYHEYQENENDQVVSLFISRISTYNGQNFSLGHSLRTGKIDEENYKRMNY